jgi:Subtilase family
MVGFNGASAPNLDNDGTSYAAPHVSGTVALLQQYAEQKIAASTPRWDADARRHEVMKAVLLNSADKYLDNGTLVVNGNTVPQGYLLGMERTVLDQNCTPPGSTNCQTWLQSEAYGDTPFSDASFIPLDDQNGRGSFERGTGISTV